MSEERLIQVILAPLVSEKTTRLAEESNQHAFRVLPDATKIEVKKAVEKMFNVTVEDVKIMNVPGKRKMFARRPGRRNAWRKAYVRLQAGQDIQLGIES